MTFSTVSAVIPTKNRHRDLCTAIGSVARQSRVPEQLILIDQSGDAPTDTEVSRLRQVIGNSVDLRWVHDPSIQGLVHAKAVGAALASGAIVCFLEDDIVLERDYFASICNGFLGDPALVGASGVVTDVPFGKAYALLHLLFHRGIFEDPRPWIYATLQGRGVAAIPSHALSGGLSAWRREVFAEVPFDTANGFHMLEDLDFSTRVRARFGDRLAILPEARLEHHFAPTGRAAMGTRERRKVIEFITFYRTRPTRAVDAAWLAWLLVGVGAAALATSVKHLSVKPLVGFVSGLLTGTRKAILPLSGVSAHEAREDPEPLSHRAVRLRQGDAARNEQLE
jgi:GT2 family glycosyltransferase